MPNSSICARAADAFASPTWLNTIGATSPARIAITVITTRSSMRVKPIADCGLWIADWTRVLRIRDPKSAIRNCLLVRDTQHLFDRGYSGLHLAPPVAPQRHHPLRD